MAISPELSQHLAEKALEDEGKTRAELIDEVRALRAARIKSISQSRNRRRRITELEAELSRVKEICSTLTQEVRSYRAARAASRAPR